MFQKFWVWYFKFFKKLSFFFEQKIKWSVQISKIHFFVNIFFTIVKQLSKERKKQNKLWHLVVQDNICCIVRGIIGNKIVSVALPHCYFYKSTSLSSRKSYNCRKKMSLCVWVCMCEASTIEKCAYSFHFICESWLWVCLYIYSNEWCTKRFGECMCERGEFEWMGN